MTVGYVITSKILSKKLNFNKFARICTHEPNNQLQLTSKTLLHREVGFSFLMALASDHGSIAVKRLEEHDTFSGHAVGGDKPNATTL